MAAAGAYLGPAGGIRVGASAQEGQNPGGKALGRGRVEASRGGHRADFRAGAAGGAEFEDIRRLLVERMVSRALTPAKCRKCACVFAFSARGSAKGVRAGTMHAMKGLEFQAVAVVGVEQELVPLTAAVTPESEDFVAHAQDLQRERCLLFVACTRARDHLYVSGTGKPSPFLAADG